MSTKVMVELDARDAATLERLARQSGYDTTTAYLHNLIQALSEADVDARDLETSFKQGLREALRGEIVPLANLWTTG